MVESIRLGSDAAKTLYEGVDLIAGVDFGDADEEVLVTIWIEARQGNTTFNSFFARQPPQKLAGVTWTTNDKFVEARPIEAERKAIELSDLPRRVR